MADHSNLIRSLVVRAEDARLMGDMYVTIFFANLLVILILYIIYVYLCIFGINVLEFNNNISGNESQIK